MVHPAIAVLSCILLSFDSIQVSLLFLKHKESKFALSGLLASVLLSNWCFYMYVVPSGAVNENDFAPKLFSSIIGCTSSCVFQ